MRCLRRSSAVRLRGSPFPQPRGPLGLLRPSRRGSSPERDTTMKMDQDIAMDDCAALKLRESASLLPQEPESHEDQRGDGQGPSASPVAWLPQRDAAPTGRRLHPEGARWRSEDLPPNKRLCRWSPWRDFHRHAKGGRDLPLADEQFRDRCVARPTARRPARGIRRRIHGRALCRRGSNRRNYTHIHCFDNTLQFINVFSRPRSSTLARRSPSAGRFRGLSVGSIRNPNRRRSFDSKYALDARAVSRLSFEPWMSNPRIRTP